MQKINFQWCRIEELTAVQLHELIAAREAVFIVEQNCVYQDADKYDLLSWHLTARIDGKVAAYIRVIDPGHKYQEPCISRVLVAGDYRGTGLGRELLKEGIKRTEDAFPGKGIRIGAQSYLLNFYKSFGFEPSSEEYLEDGIPHIEMFRSSEKI